LLCLIFQISQLAMGIRNRRIRTITIFLTVFIGLKFGSFLPSLPQCSYLYAAPLYKNKKIK
jgi:hypothetical protein